LHITQIYSILLLWLFLVSWCVGASYCYRGNRPSASLWRHLVAKRRRETDVHPGRSRAVLGSEVVVRSASSVSSIRSLRNTDNNRQTHTRTSDSTSNQHLDASNYTAYRRGALFFWTFPTSLPAQGAKWSDTGFDYYKTDQRSSFAEDVFESPDNRINHFAKEQRARRKSASRSPRRFYQASHLQHRTRTLRSHIEEGRPAFTLSTKQDSPPLSQQPFPVPDPNPR
jgi:hypothetical protein